MDRRIQFLSMHYGSQPQSDIAPYDMILFHHKFGKIPLYGDEYWTWKLAPWWKKNHYIKQIKKKRDQEPLSRR